MKKIKLDENFPPSMVDVFHEDKIDASSVFSQKISGSSDDSLFEICKKEGRILITFDLDFANIIRYPAETTKGIIICRSRKKINIKQIKSLCKRLVQLIIETETEQKLFITEEAKIRVRKPDTD